MIAILLDLRGFQKTMEVQDDITFIDIPFQPNYKAEANIDPKASMNFSRFVLINQTEAPNGQVTGLFGELESY